MIKAKVANPDSRGSTAYSVVLIIVNVLFFLSVWWNAWAMMSAAFSRRHIQVFPQDPNYLLVAHSSMGKDRYTD